MKLTKLTESQKARLSEIRSEYITKFLDGGYAARKINKEIALAVIEFVYSIIKKPMPKVYVVSSPIAAQRLANKLKGTEKKFYTFGTYLTMRWASFYAYYDTFIEFGILDPNKFAKYFKLREFVHSGIEFTIEFENAIIISQPAIYYKRENGRLHCLTGPACEWEDGYKIYAIRGRRMPSWIFEKFKSKTLTKEMFINEQNEDVKAGINELFESEKEGAMMHFLGAEEVDRCVITHDIYNPITLVIESQTEELILYKTSEKFKEETDLKGRSNVPLAWISMRCPSTESQYLIPTDSSFLTAIEAAKYHRPEIPVEVEYKWNSRS
jgi:hypothetical protein